MARKKTTSLTHIVALSSGESETEIMLTPWGTVRTTKGEFKVDDEAARLIVEDFNAGKKDIPIDFEHTTVGGNYSTPSGAAPAAGWITGIIVRSGVGIFASVKWNAAAKAMIEADEYRYISPVISIRKDDRKAVGISSAALTNKPAIFDMERVAAKDDSNGENPMDLKALRDALASAGIKLADDADDGMILSAACETLVKIKPQDDAANAAVAIANSVRSKLGVAKDAGIEVIAAKFDEMRTETVPASEYKAVTDRLATLELAAKSREAQELVASAVEAAKLNPNNEKQMEWARDYARVDSVGFKKWSDSAPELYTAGRVVVPSKVDGVRGRDKVIAEAKEEFSANRSQLNGIQLGAFVNSALTMAGETLLTADEKKALN